MRMIPRFRASRRGLTEIILSIKYFLDEAIVKALLGGSPANRAQQHHSSDKLAIQGKEESIRRRAE
ncbi:hypothetical protein [Bradyrhizobium liaoningense]|uniref:hypothetical protein n=1 Tax=Bradyrhizobium liaoningense TaxID=43992 RepID=UPI001BA8C54D|nr:hypothetical protein [Bradyrhizobium liaoningense]MBR0712363.1 hypothetical protein [Bradyrhizobium liaoningense]